MAMNSGNTATLSDSGRRRLKRLRLRRNLTLLFTFGAIISGIATYWAIARSTHPLGPNPDTVMIMILLNLFLLLGLGVLISRRAYSLWDILRRGASGSRLQTRILVMFSLLTIIPAVLVSIFAALFFHFGIQAWFNDRVDTALDESVHVAQSYIEEHQEIIRQDALAMANDLDRQAHKVIGSPALLNQIVNSQAVLRSLTEGVVIQRNRIIAQTSLSFALAFEHVEADKIERAANGDIVVWVEDNEKLRAFIKLHAMPDAYLLIGRLIDPEVLQHMASATGSVAEYKRLKENVSRLQYQFSLVFGVVVLLLLLAAIGYGMHFAARLVIPITRLIKAAEQVRAGHFDTKVPLHSHDDEITTLGRAFNRMTDELRKQRNDLIEANRQIDERRRFSEAVLAGVSAGVIALDSEKNITLSNRIAFQLLRRSEEETSFKGKPIHEVCAPIAESINEAERGSDQLIQREITLTNQGKSKTLLVRITVERYNNTIEGYILTFDDITELVNAQRHAAWSDVARRVAHEIKNPLTPIQLASERLRKKYGKQIESDSDAYFRYIDTITRHVGDIGKMVEEFVSFARMPSPVFYPEDIEVIIRKVAFSEGVAHSRIRYEIVDESIEKVILGDIGQLSRIFTNLLKNAAEAIEAHFTSDEQKGEITIRLHNSSDRMIDIDILDDGPGFPEDKLSSLLEPYVTTREKGTGLGLAIVKKIVEDHHGQILLKNRENGGAQVHITFPIDSGKNVT